MDDGGPGDSPRARRKAAHAIGAAAAAAVVLVPGAPRDPLLVWNASASSPRGLYAVLSGRPEKGDVVIVRPPAQLAALAAARGYLPRGVVLVKTIAAGPGDRVCAAGPVVTINGHAAALRRSRDGAGRALPRWRGCRVLARGDVLLLGRADPASFDGRYFGPLRADRIVGRATLLWRA